ncbi:pyrimidine reductase family protein [Gordonia sp. CPCC 205515]|uniref:pyrimidine reductase family protein n=1 Tax=Gordonia sp. CPCC 205515 TaxID=3140791 RepID=UPI003AF36A14
MFGLQKATQLTSDDETATLRWLAEQYAYPASDRPYLRVNMVSSIDGAVTHNGKSGDLAGPGDKAIFHVLRGLADVVLVGARTAVTEGYRQPSPDDAFTDAREAAGQTPAPALVLVSRSLSIPADYAPLANPTTLVFTCASADATKRAALTDAGATLVDCGDDTVEVAAMLDECTRRGWLRVLSEGGPSLLGSFVAADAVDELCVTTSPNLVAGDAERIAHGSDPAHLRPMRPTTIITDDDGFVFTRWTRG